jgi:asparagine synthetase A
MAGVLIDESHQKELTCLANCQLDNSIKIHQKLVNSKLKQANSRELGACRFFSSKK